MKNITIFCITLKPEHEELIKKLSFVPVGLGEEKFSENCLSDKNGRSISYKNPFYGEYTFHYWIWKNYLDQIKTEWVGFCQYRKFFAKKKFETKNIRLEEFKNNLLLDVNSQEKNINCILGSQFSVQEYKLSKIIKYHLPKFLSQPSLFFDKKKRTLKLQFDLFHGKGNLERAINLLDKENKDDFQTFMNNENSFNPHNMFFCKKKILNDYYSVIFPWLEKCEELFKFENKGIYGLQRIYGFLAERFLSYWFKKNSNHIEIPIVGKDLSDYKNL